MAITLIAESTKWQVIDVILDEAEDRFALKCESTESDADVKAPLCFVFNPLGVPPKERSSSEYNVALFSHQNWPESRVVSLRNEDGRYLGLAFSMEAITEGAEALQSDEYNNAYGFHALKQLCLGHVSKLNVEVDCTVGDTYSITEFFPPDAVVVVCLESQWRAAFPEIRSFDDFIERALPTFAKAGLRAITESSKGFPPGLGTQSFGEELQETKRLTVKLISADFPSNPRAFLLKLLSGVTLDRHPAFRFFLLYQLFELLMQVLYEEYLGEFRQTAQLAQYDNPVAMRELIDNFKDSLSEKGRMRKILESNPQISTQASGLKNVCAPLLATLGFNEEEDPSAAIYRIRNLLFHSFNEVDESGTDLTDLADLLLLFFCDLSICFRRPAITLRRATHP
jgi:hypothetical protein